MKNKKPFSIAPLVLALSLSLPLTAQAVALGDLEVASHLGQRLSGSIRLSGDDWKQLEPDCFFPTQPLSPSSQGLPWISRYNINLRKGKAGASLLLTTPKALDEPLLTLAIRVGCGVDVVREYVLLLSPPPSVAPPVTLARSPASEPVVRPKEKVRAGAKKAAPIQTHTWIIGAGESVQSLAASLYPSNPAMRKAFATAVYQANPELAMEYSSHDLLPQGLALEIPDLRLLANSAAAARSAREEMISPPVGGSRKAAIATAASGASRTGEKPVADHLVISAEAVPEVYPGDEVFRERLHDTQMDLHQLGQFMANNLQTGEAPSSDPAILELQTRLATLQLALEKIRQAELTASAPVPVSEPPVPTELKPVEPPLSVLASEAAVTPVQEARKVPLPAAKQANFLEMLLLGGAMGALGVGLGAWLVQRKQRGPDREWADSLQQSSASHPVAEPVKPPRSMMGVFKKPALEEDGLVEPRFNLPQVHEISSGANPLEFTDLTDFMLATGRVESAAQFLQDFIEAEPDKALSPWIKLLSSYQKLGKEKEFHWVARQLHQHFNVAELRWGENPEKLIQSSHEEVARLGRRLPQSIEEIPHVCAMVTGLWGNPACYRYLESLLRDNREGQRQGFSLQVVQEILFLMHLLQQEAYAEKRLI